MQKVIISDTSCLILLQNIGELDLLFKLFGTVITTPEVSSEFGQQLPDWIDIKQPKDKKYQFLIEVSVDRGEASAIALAIEYENSLLIIDDLKGRKLAQKLGLEITGTGGVIIDAKLSGLIPSLNELLVKIENTDFRISENLKKIILRKAGEL